MKQSSLSMLVFTLYMGALCVGFLLFPVRFVTFIRERQFRFYQWTFLARLVLLPAFLVFVLLDIAPPILLAFGTFETGCGIWTGLALRHEHRHSAQA